MIGEASISTERLGVLRFFDGMPDDATWKPGDFELVAPAMVEDVTVENFVRAESDHMIRASMNTFGVGIARLTHVRESITPDDQPAIRMNPATLNNAGPARVRQLRQLREEAARTGLDPNVWFGNVEHVAAKRVGRETVQYVSTIAKYYVACKQTAPGVAIVFASLGSTHPNNLRALARPAQNTGEKAT